MWFRTSPNHDPSTVMLHSCSWMFVLISYSPQMKLWFTVCRKAVKTFIFFTFWLCNNKYYILWGLFFYTRKHNLMNKSEVEGTYFLKWYANKQCGMHLHSAPFVILLLNAIKCNKLPLEAYENLRKQIPYLSSLLQHERWRKRKPKIKPINGSGKWLWEIPSKFVGNKIFN